jgi:RNA polymerase sigma-70 factor (ECF subfamily)
VKLNASEFAGVIRANQNMVYSIAWHYLRDHASAEEIAQDVFLDLHRNIGAIESERHVTNWLRKVASQRCIDQTRRLRVRPRSGLDSVAEPPVHDRECDPLLSSRLEKLIEGLPDRAKMAVILRYQEEMDIGEIAEAMGIPEGSVKSTLHRTLGLLREKLERSLKGVAR